MDGISIIVCALVLFLTITSFYSSNKKLQTICTIIFVAIELLFLLETLLIGGYYSTIFEFYLALIAFIGILILYIWYIVLLMRRKL